MKDKILRHFEAPFCVVGGGISGQSIMRLLEDLGFVSGQDFALFDDKLSSAHYNDSQKMLSELKARTLIVSPGVPLSTPWIREAFAGGLKITSELSVASLYLSDEKVLGVTGSLGKSTTVSLLGAGLRKFSTSAFVGGNLGFPLSDYVRELLSKKRPQADWVVLELSSFQLENAAILPIHYSAITYLSPNHLERYTDLKNYYQTKWTLVQKTREHCVLNRKGGDLENYAAQQAEFNRCTLVDQNCTELSEVQLSKSKLIGRHNRDNIAVAYAVARKAEWPPYCIQGMLEFAGLKHRMQNLGSIGGIYFINDSKATAMESVLTAAQGVLSENRKGDIYLLLGGRDKKLPWGQLSTLAQTPVHPIFFGECALHAREISQLEGPDYPTLKDSLKYLRSVTKFGDTILLSPGGTSLDEFMNFEDRGIRFQEMAHEFFDTKG